MRTKLKVVRSKGERLNWIPKSQVRQVRLDQVTVKPVRVRSSVIKKKNQLSSKTEELYIP